ncbi:F-box domain-containing protein [Mycena indigotica]|uniref:F-box domain-containing protein n=1 Tax=Mycena indigotica TaxID=2126181 RepID=A0A8H6T973_9AGAR|nr:F-box domain-containing protein [Mycena indigotica]KAF7312652.1 F-box domain-containing protein [Mycena indigotica]
MSALGQLSAIRPVQSFITTLLGPLQPSCPPLPLPKRAMILELPDELLWGIFSRCMDPHSSPFSTENPLWPLMKVCVRWRNVILDAPQFWRHISFPDWRKRGRVENLEQDAARVSQQVENSGEVPVTINLIPIPGSDAVVDTLLTTSTRVEAANLVLDKHLLQRFSSHAEGFPILSKLVVQLSEKLEESEEKAAANFFGGLQALTNLSVTSEVAVDWVPVLVPLQTMWSQLRVCELTESVVDDVLFILPHLSPGTRLALILGHLRRTEEVDTLPIIDHCNIQSLSFDRCGDEFVSLILGRITAPSLQRLAIWWFNRSPHLDTITAMLQRSSASLTHFAMRLLCANAARRQGLDGDTMVALFEFLNSEHVRDLIDLDLTLVSRYTPPTLELLDALAGVPNPWEPDLKLPTLPKLRSLALRAYDEEDGEWERRLLAIAAKRTPVFRSLWLDDPLLNPSLGHRALKNLRQKLEKHGVELVCSYDGDMGTW